MCVTAAESALLPDNDQIIAATYLRYLPTEAELQAELMRERELAERQLRLAVLPPPGRRKAKR